MEERVKTAEYWINEQLTLLMTVLQAASKDFEERFSGEMDRLLYEARLEQGITGGHHQPHPQDHCYHQR